MASFTPCSKCGGPMEWNEKLQCWVCYGCEEAAKLFLGQLVECVQRRNPNPIDPIPGDGFVILSMRPEPKPRRRVPEHIMLGMLGSLMVSLSTLAFLYFAAPSIFNQ